MKTFTKTLLALAVTTALASCGGGGDKTPTAVVELVVDPVVELFKAQVVVEQGAGTTGFDIYHNTAASIATGDFNGDGFEDLVVTYPGIESDDIAVTPHTKVAIKIYLQDANGGLYDGTSEVFGSNAVPGTHFTRNISVADFNGDDQDDIFLGNHGIEEIHGYGQDYWGETDTLILSQANGKYVDASSSIVWTTKTTKTLNWEGADAHYTHGTTVADFQGDGDMDLLVNTTTGAGTVILVNDGAGNFTEWDKMPVRVEVFPTHTSEFNLHTLWSALVDVDNDSNLDLVLAGDSVYLNDGFGNFNWNGAKVEMPAPLDVGRVEDMAIDDIDGDGNIDLMVSNSEAGSFNQFVQVLMGNGDGTFTDDTLNREENGDKINIAVVFHTPDLNNDGKKDIVATSYDSTVGDSGTTTVLAYINVDGVFTKVDSAVTVSGNNNIIPIDLSDDGDIDVFVSSNNISYFTANMSF